MMCLGCNGFTVGGTSGLFFVDFAASVSIGQIQITMPRRLDGDRRKMREGAPIKESTSLVGALCSTRCIYDMITPVAHCEYIWRVL